MRIVDCQSCEQKNIPFNEIIKVDEQLYCTNCISIHFNNESELEGKNIIIEFDPTICSKCDTDYGNLELQKISGHPICDDCSIIVSNVPIPNWVKVFFAVIILSLIATYYSSLKYYKAYNYSRQSFVYYEKDDTHNASIYMSKAANITPNVEDLQVLKNYFKGVDLLLNDKNDSSLIELNKCIGKLPEDYDLNHLILTAKRSDFYNKKNYVGFLNTSKELLALNPKDVSSIACVASAYSCLYAQKRQMKLKDSTILLLNTAKAIDDTSSDITKYYNMIEYRLYSKTIIDKNEFNKQFPNGWIKPS